MNKLMLCVPEDPIPNECGCCPLKSGAKAIFSKTRIGVLQETLRECRAVLADAFVAGFPGAPDQLNRAWEAMQRIDDHLMRLERAVEYPKGHPKEGWYVIPGEAPS